MSNHVLVFQQTFFNKNNGTKREEANGEGGKGELAKKEGSKKMSVERVYQKKTQLEHILLRPDTYIGSVETVTQVRPSDDHVIPKKQLKALTECNMAQTFALTML